MANIVYNFDIKAGGYDLPAFIKKPYNACDDNNGKNILNLLKLTNKCWLDGEEEYNILKYDKSKVTPEKLIIISKFFHAIAKEFFKKQVSILGPTIRFKNINKTKNCYPRIRKIHNKVKLI